MKRLLTAATALILAFAGSASAGQFYGGKAFLHTNTALVMPPGALDMSLYTRGYTGPVEGEDYFISNGTSAMATTFGFSRRVEVGFTQILYQDLNATTRTDKDVATMIPGNTYIRIKAAGYPMGEHMFWGIISALRYRVALYQDVHLEPYQGSGIEPEITSLFSYYVKPLYPDEAPSFHLNLGYLNHNDGETPTSSAQELTYLVSAMFPRPRYDYGFEIYGSNFLKQPGDTVLSREDWLYITPMVRYKLFKGLTFTLGLDVLIIGGTDESVPSTDPLPNYSPWRLAMKVDFTPSTAFYAAPTFVKATAPGGRAGRQRRTYASGGEEGGGMNPMFSRQELFRWGIEERGGDIQSLDLDLEKLRQERKKAEEELKALKTRLEEKQKAEQK